jgi:amidase
MAKYGWRELVAEETKRREATLPKWYFELPDIPDDVLDVTDLPEKLGILSAPEIEITHLDGVGVVNAIREKKYSCVEVVEAFTKRAVIAHKYVCSQMSLLTQTNCLNELMYEPAIERAKYLDSLSEPMGPLHGLPISVKEHLWIKGYPCNAAFVAWTKRKPVPENNAVVDILLSLGAIPFCRTTQPQALMHLACNSNVTGKTLCPYNRTLTSGGSSGGEGALIAMKGSCMGLGTDIGGSVRSPAANCGIYSLRQSAMRIPLAGMSFAMAGAESVLPILGPMCASQRDITMFMTLVLGTQPWKKDPFLVPVPWRQPWLGEKIRVAIMWNDGVVVPHPPVTRALKEVKAALEKYPDQFEITEWIPLNHAKGWEIIAGLYFMDGGKQDKAAMEESGEPLEPLTEFIMTNKHVKDNNVTEVWEVFVHLSVN